jgi:hypothetical protein
MAGVFDLDTLSSAPVEEARMVPASKVIAELTGLRGRELHMCPLPDHKHDKRSKPAFMIYPKLRGWYCFSCNRGGSALEFVMLYKGMTTEEAAYDIVGENKEDGTGFKIALDMLGGMREEDKLKDRIAKLDRGWLEAELEKRRKNEFIDVALDDLARKWGVRTDLLRSVWRIGWDESEHRYWIPVYTRDGQLVDVRRRSEIGTIPKVKSMAGFGVGGHLFGDAVTSYFDTHVANVVIVGGEKDVIIGRYHCDPAVFVSGTTGEGSWNPDTMSEPLRDRDVTVFYDDDKTGRAGTKVVCDALKGVAREVRAVEWPIFETLPGKDISDLILSGNVGIANKLIESARVVHADPLKGVRGGK